jgi:hypothetical protein
VKYLKLVLGAAALLALTGCESPEVRAQRRAADEAQTAERAKQKPLEDAYEAARQYVRVRHKNVIGAATMAESSIEQAGARAYRVKTWVETKSYDGQYTFRHAYICEVSFDEVRSCKEEKQPAAKGK